MIIMLPDGDNGFYTDENEGKRFFPQTKNPKACDDFNSGEGLNYSLFPFLYMKPGALGRYESYFLEFVNILIPNHLTGKTFFPLGVSEECQWVVLGPRSWD